MINIYSSTFRPGVGLRDELCFVFFRGGGGGWDGGVFLEFGRRDGKRWDGMGWGSCDISVAKSANWWLGAGGMRCDVMREVRDPER